jgi:serine/threonine-protein kinase RsbW
MTTPKLWMAIPANIQLVYLPAAALQGILRALACEEGQAALIELCVVEAVNNAIKHAYAQDPSGLVELRLDVRDDTLEIVIADAGRTMPAGLLDRARARLDEPPGECREGGYGLGIILSVMSEVGYRTDGNVNLLTMTAILTRSVV